MRIIAGKHKNRIIPTSKKADYRPSTTKFREAIFNILSSGKFFASQPIIGAKVLDLFSGTGGLAFEALSRGAKSILLVDNKEEHLKSSYEFAKKIGEELKISTLLTDATNLPISTNKYNVVFIDPPYYHGYIDKALQSLIKQDWIEDGAIIVIEMQKTEQIILPKNMYLYKEKLYNNNKLLILKYEQN